MNTLLGSIGRWFFVFFDRIEQEKSDILYMISYQMLVMCFVVLIRSVACLTYSYVLVLRAVNIGIRWLDWLWLATELILTEHHGRSLVSSWYGLLGDVWFYRPFFTKAWACVVLSWWCAMCSIPFLDGEGWCCIAEWVPEHTFENFFSFGLVNIYHDLLKSYVSWISFKCMHRA